MDPIPYALCESDTLGRFMIANKDLELGEIIFEEYPIASGLIVPDSEYDCSSICVECYKVETEEKCAGCGFPICESHDPRLPKQHRPLECDLLRKCVNYASQWCQNDTQLRALISSQLFFMRCLLLENEEATKFKNLEPNYEQWSKSKLCEQFQEQIQLLTLLFGSIYKFPTDQELCKVKARQDINSYEIKLPKCGIQAVYGLASMLEHNCVPNTHRSTQTQDLKLIVRAAQKISVGAHLSLSYSDLFSITAQRQKEFQGTKFFTCACSRCEDPSECGTFLSALRCPNCSSDKVDSPMLPLPGVYPYKCTNCDFVKDYQEILGVVLQAREQLEEIESIAECGDEDSDDPKSENVMRMLMAWMCRWTCASFVDTIKGSSSANSSIRLEARVYLDQVLRLHRQNTLVLDACHTMFLLISITAQDTTNDELTLKIKLGQHLVQTMAPITPGISKFRCTVAHDLAHAQVLLATSTQTGMELQTSLKSSLEMWKEALNCLQYEPQDTSEGVLYAAGLSEYQKYCELLQ